MWSTVCHRIVRFPLKDAPTDLTKAQGIYHPTSDSFPTGGLDEDRFKNHLWQKSVLGLASLDLCYSKYSEMKICLLLYFLRSP